MNRQGKNGIEWCDATWSPIVGCLNGCSYCYGRRFAERGMGEYGVWPKEERFKPRLLADRLKDPFPTRGKPLRIFAGSMTDFWSDGVKDEWRDRVWNQFEIHPRHTFLVLTKRPERASAYVKSYSEEPLPNLWLGTSITNQEDAEERIPWLLRTPAALRFLSIEPILDRVRLTGLLDGISWVIIGKETGNRKAKIEPNSEWVDRILSQCDVAGVPVFLKTNLGYVIQRQEFPNVGVLAEPVP